jgi:hypothetical protein
MISGRKSSDSYRSTRTPTISHGEVGEAVAVEVLHGHRSLITPDAEGHPRRLWAVLGVTESSVHSTDSPAACQRS